MLDWHCVGKIRNWRLGTMRKLLLIVLWLHCQLLSVRFFNTTNCYINLNLWHNDNFLATVKESLFCKWFEFRRNIHFRTCEDSPVHKTCLQATKLRRKIYCKIGTHHARSRVFPEVWMCKCWVFILPFTGVPLVGKFRYFLVPRGNCQRLEMQTRKWEHSILLYREILANEMDIEAKET